MVRPLLRFSLLMVCLAAPVELRAESFTPRGPVTASATWSVNLRDINYYFDEAAPKEGQKRRPVRRAPATDVDTPPAASDASIGVSPTPTQTPSNAPQAFRSIYALNDDFTTYTPDIAGAVGVRSLLTIAGTTVRVFNKDESANVGRVHLDDFLGSNYGFEPRVAYDAEWNRFVLAALDLTSTGKFDLIVAVSKGSEPTEWNLFRFPLDPEKLGNSWSELPRVGFNGKHIVVTANVSIPGFASEVVVLDKLKLYQNVVAGKYYLVPAWRDLAPTLGHTPSEKVYLVSAHSAYAGQVRVRTVDDVSLDDHLLVSGRPWASWGPGGRQLDSTSTIGLGTTAMVNAVYRQGKVYAVHTAYLPADTASRAAVQYWQIAVDAPFSAVQYTIEDTTNTSSYGYPSIAVNGAHDVMIGMSVFSPHHYPSAGYAIRRGADAEGIVSKPWIYKRGLAPWNVHAWGVHSATVVDPSADVDFWTMQEYAETPQYGYDRWGTWWAMVRTPPAAAPQLTATSNGTSVTVNWTSVGTSGYDLQRTTDGTTFIWPAYSGSSPATDSSVQPNKVYGYRVRGYNTVAGYIHYTGWSNLDVAATIAFTDNPLAADRPIKRVHLTELRDAVNAYRAIAGLPAMAYADDPLPLIATVRAQHMRDLRNGLAAARAAMGLPPLVTTDPTLRVGISGIRAVHVQELRDAMK